MSSRFGRDTARDDLFSSYNRSASPSKSKSKARASPYNAGGYGLPADGPGFSAYPSNGNTNGSLYEGYGAGSGYGVGAKKSDDGLNGGYRAATPNSRGQYNSATLDELESQNEEQTGVLIGKVKMLKDVRFLDATRQRDEQHSEYPPEILLLGFRALSRPFGVRALLTARS